MGVGDVSMTVEKPVAAGEIVALWLSIISDHAAIDTQVVLVVLRRLTFARIRENAFREGEQMQMCRHK